MFENIMKIFKKINKKEEKSNSNSKEAAKERLHLVLMQDRANVSADFLELMKQEIIEVIKKYIDVDESAIDVRLTNKENEDGTNGAPALYANIPILNIKNEARKVEVESKEDKDKEKKREEKTEAKKENETEIKEQKENVELKVEEVSKVQEEPKKENTKKIEKKNKDENEEEKKESEENETKEKINSKN